MLCSPTTATILILISLSLSVVQLRAFSGQPQSSKNPVKVLVTGAAGKTGRIVLSKLGHDHRYEPKGLFRTEQSARETVKNEETVCSLEHVVVADVTSDTFIKDLSQGVSDDKDDDGGGGDEGSSSSFEGSPSGINRSKSNGLENFEAMVICTSAVPRIRKRSLATMLVKAPWRVLKGEPFFDVHSMRFAWKYGGYPEKVDFRGQIAQIDLAKKLGIPHVVLVSSMGGTDPDNFLNTVGKNRSKLSKKKNDNDNEKDDGHSDILLWKRRAEKYLVESGLDYTILHPGHLVDSPGGHEEFMLGVDDELYYLYHKKKESSDKPKAVTRISREDLADLCVAALSAGKGKKVSLDCITVSPSESSSSSSSSLLSNGQSPKSQSTSATDGDTPATSSTRSSAEIISSATTTYTISERSSETGRKSAEEVLNDFFDLSITTNYDRDP